MNARPPGLPEELGRWVDSELFERAPLSIAVIDPALRVLVANSNFVAVFGEPGQKACYEVYKDRDAACPGCAVLRTMRDGKSRISDEQGIDCIGTSAAYVVHHSPVHDPEGRVVCVVNMSYDVTERQDILSQYNMIFDRAPCALSVINKDYRIVRANERVRAKFGSPIGAYCYRVYKQRSERCEECPAQQTFADGQLHSASQIRRAHDGSVTHHLVSTTPLAVGARHPTQVIEMSLDVTEARVLSDRLLGESLFRETITETAIDALVAVDETGLVTIYNPAAEQLFGIAASEVVGRLRAERFYPPAFCRAIYQGGAKLELPETTVLDASGRAVPVRFSGTVLHRGDAVIGGAAFFQDLRSIKRLEQQQIESARLAAVGQTVTQLAHSIKNILTGLQGGIYDIRTGAERPDAARAREGLETLERNYQRITALVRDFLRFSKEHEPELVLSDPNAVGEEIHALFRQVADKHGIRFVFEPLAGIAPVMLDPSGIHTCLANLVTNAFDACRAAGRGGCAICLRVDEAGPWVVFEVRDTGCGMDDEIRQQIFRNLVTTKGPCGTGLGLVMTQKIVADHGGRIDWQSAPGVGSTFRVELPRLSLPRPSERASQACDRSR